MRGNGSNTRGNDNNTRGSGSQTRGKMEFRFSVRPDAVLKFLELLLADSSAHREVSDHAAILGFLGTGARGRRCRSGMFANLRAPLASAWRKGCAAAPR